MMLTRTCRPVTAASIIGGGGGRKCMKRLVVPSETAPAASSTATSAARITSSPLSSWRTATTHQQPQSQPRLSLARNFHPMVNGKQYLQQQPRRLASSSTTTTSSSTSSSQSNHQNGGSNNNNNNNSSSSNNKTGKKSFMEWYEEQLNQRPVFTKMVTGSFLWGLGDAVAQFIPQVTAAATTTSVEEENHERSSSSSKPSDHHPHPPVQDPPPPPVPSIAASSSSPSFSNIQYDWPRTLRAVFFGFAIHAPTSHLHYNLLEWMTVRAGITGGIQIPLFKAFMEQFVYWSWISNSLYHAAMGAMQGMNATQIYQKIEAVLWETQKAQWVFWIPVQLLNFRFVPVRHQLNVVLLTSVVWTALLSAWYPPEKEEQQEESKQTETSSSTDTNSTKLSEKKKK